MKAFFALFQNWFYICARFLDPGADRGADPGTSTKRVDTLLGNRDRLSSPCFTDSVHNRVVDIPVDAKETNRDTGPA